MDHAHSHSHAADSYTMESARWSAGRNTMFFAALISVIACIAGYYLDEARFFRSYLVAFTYATGIGLGAFFFVMVQYLSGSAWSVVVRRIMENLMTALPVCGVLFVPIAFGLKHLYPWTDSALMHSNEMLAAKADYLTPYWFILRGAIFFVLWTIWVFAIYSQSTKQDNTKSIQQTHAISRWSAPGLFLVVVVGSVASFDWLMSLEPGWYSTIFGLYYLADGALAFMSVLTLIALAFRKNGLLSNTIRDEHYHDLGKWLFALTCFYSYMAVSQYLLIWYADLPEETVFFRHRAHGGWLAISAALPFLRFFIPFFVLLCRPAKRTTTLIGVMAGYSLIMVYLDLYWVVMPNFYEEGPQLHWLDLATLGATMSIGGLAFWSRFKKNKMVPAGDLRLEQSLHFENV